jgi:hypothetical protein
MSRALRSERLEKKRRIRAAALSGVIAAASGLLFFGIYRMVNASWAQVALVDVAGTEVLSRDELLTAASAVLAEPRAIVPRTSSFFFDKGHVEAHVSARFPRIMEVDVRRTGWKTARLIVAERAPAAYACTLAACVSLDEAGNVFAEAPSFALSDLPVIEVPDLPVIGSEFLTPSSLMFVVRAWEGLQTLAKKPIRASLSGDDLRVDFSEGSVLISARLPLSDSLEVLRAAARQEPAASVIDVRFPGKVIYRDERASIPVVEE